MFYLVTKDEKGGGDSQTQVAAVGVIRRDDRFGSSVLYIGRRTDGRANNMVLL